MWHTNVKVQYYYTNAGPQAAFAVIEGLTGWKRVAPGSGDGVTNVGAVLSAAKSHDRPVRVFLAGDQIERAMVS